MEQDSPIIRVTQDAKRAPRARGGRSGFGVAPILYMLGLIGVGAGILFSSYSQTLKTNMQMTNNLAVKSDLDASATTLAATSVLGSTDAGILCPPQGGAASSNCANAPAKMADFFPPNKATVAPEDARLPKDYALAASAGAPAEAGIFTPGAGVKQVDPWGHYYIYCRWEAQGSAPAFEIISAGPDGKLQTNCGAAVAAGDDTIIRMDAANAVNRSAVWQTGTVGNGTSTPDVYYGTVGHQLSIDANGNMTVPGNIAVEGSYSSPDGNIALGNGTLTGNVVGGSIAGTSGTFTGDLSAENSGFATGAGGSLTAAGGAFQVGSGGSLTAAGGMLNLDTLGNLTVGSSALTVSSNGNTGVGGNLSVTGPVALSSSLTTIGLVTIGTNAAPSGSASPLLTVGRKVGLYWPFMVDQYGGVTASNFNGTLNGSVNGGTVTASSVVDNGTLQVAGNYTSANGNITVGGTVTASNFSGQMSIGSSGGLTLNGAIPIANGGTGATSASGALANLGVTSGGYLSSALLTSNLIPGADLVNQSVGTSQLSSTGVVPGLYNAVVVGSDGRVISGTLTQYDPAAIYDGAGDAVMAGTSGIQVNVGGVAEGFWNATGLDIGSSAAAKNRLDVYGGAAIGSPYAGIVKAPNNGLIVAGSVGIGTSSPTAPLQVTGNVVATGFVGSGSQLTGIGTGSLTGTMAPGNGGTGTNTIFTQGSVVFAGAGGVYSQDNANFFYDATNRRLGVGTDAPSQMLSVSGGNIQIDNGQQFLTKNASGNPMGVAAASGNDLVIGSSNVANLLFGTNAAPRAVTISSTGLVGVGSYTPVVSLDLSQHSDALALPSGDNTSRPSGAAAVNGEIRYNSSLPGVEALVNGSWSELLASGGSSGSVSVPQGGTGDSSLTAHAVMIGEGTSPVGTAGPGDLYTVLIGKGSTNDPVFSSAPIVDNMTVRNEEILTFASDYVVPGVQSDVALGSTSAIRYNGSGDATFNGIVQGDAGQIVYLHNATLNKLTLANESASEGTLNNRILTGLGTSLVMQSDSSVTLQYDGAASRWRVIGGSGGGIPAGTTGQIQFNSGQNTFAADAALYWDNTDKWLGIGSATPAYPVDVAGAVAGNRVHVYGQTGSQGGNGAAQGGDGYVQYSAEGALAGSPNFYWDNSAAELGLGTSLPVARLDVEGIAAINVTGKLATSLGGGTPEFQIEEGAGIAQALVRATNDAYGPHLVFQKTRGADGTVLTSVQNGDSLGHIVFGGADGSNWQWTAQIQARVNGTVGSGMVPTDLIFDTGTTGYGSERMRLTSAGAVGIATATPNSLLQVYGGEVQIGSSGNACGAGNGGAIRYYQGRVYYCDDTNTTWHIVTSDETSISTSQISGTLTPAQGGTGTNTVFTPGSVVFAGTNGVYSQDNANFFWDDSHDRMGIGTGAPTNPLDIAGTGTNFQIRFRGSANEGGIGSDANGLVRMVGTSGGAFGVGSASGNSFTEVMRFDSSGDVGVGTNAPHGLLDVYGNSNAGDMTLGPLPGNANLNAIYMNGQYGSGSSYNFASGAADQSLYINRPSAAPIRFRENNVDEMTIAAGGNVGIGTSTPGSALHVYGGSALLTVTNGALSTTLNGNQLASVGGPLYLNYQNSLNTIINSGGGNVGIGTSTPTHLLSLDGQTAHTIWMERNPTAAGRNLTVQAGGGASGVADQNGGTLVLSGGIATGLGSSSIQFRTYPAAGASNAGDNTPVTAMTVLGNGNVGIGTAAPQGALHIASSTSNALEISDATGTANVLKISGNNSVDTTVPGIRSDGSNLVLNAKSGGGVWLNDDVNGPVIIAPGIGNVGVGTASPAVSLDVSHRVDALALPAGDNSGRPVTLINGEIRYNSSIPGVEAFINGTWQNILASGDGSSAVIGSGTLNYIARWTPDSHTLGTGMLYDNGTNVGVGTANPLGTLNIIGPFGLPSASGSNASDTGLRLGNSANPAGAELDFGQDGTAGAWLQSRLSTNYATDYPLLLNPNGGNVGIGTTAVAEAPLQFGNANGNKIVLYSNGSGLDYGFGINGANLAAFVPSGGHFSLRQNGYGGSEVATVDYNGNGTFAGTVGVGTAASYALDVYNAQTAGLRLMGGNGSGDANQGAQITLTNLNASSGMQSKFMRVGSGGNLQFINSAYSGAILSATDAGTVIAGANFDATSGNGYLSEFTNDGSTGTGLNLLAKLNAAGAAVQAATGDTDGMIGVVAAGAGMSGTAQIAVGGDASCVFDGPTQAGDYVTISATQPGECHDAGATRPTATQTVGRVLSTNAAAGGGTYAMAVGLSASASADGAPTGSGSLNYVARWTPSGTALGTGTLYDNGTRVGIGTAGPSDALHVFGGDMRIDHGTVGQLSMWNGASWYGSYGLSGAGMADGSSDLALFASSNRGIRFYTNFANAGSSNEPMVLTSGGLVGIGTANPAVRLDVEANASNFPVMRVLNTNAAPIATVFSDGGQNGWFQVFTATGGESVRLNSSGNSFLNGGNVGIGTTAPGSILSIAGTVGDTVRIGQTTSTPGNYFLNIGMDTTNGFGDINATKYGQTSQPLALQRYGGDVGIGTTSPAVSLDLSNETDALALPSGTNGLRPANLINGEIRYNSSIPGVEAFINGNWENLLDSSNSNAVVGSGTPNYVARWTPNGTTLGTGTLYDNGAQVGVGTTSPLGALTVGAGNQGISLNATDIGTGAWIRNDGANTVFSTNIGSMYFGSNGSAKNLYFYPGGSTPTMTVNGGNVGIGTASPSQMLSLYAASPELSFYTTTSSRAATVGMNDGFNLYVNGPSNGYNIYNAAAHLFETGTVGIGTTTLPTYNLTSYGQINGGSESQLLRLARNENYALGGASDYRDYVTLDQGFLGGTSARAGVPAYSAYILSEFSATPTTTGAAPYPLYLGTVASSDGTAGAPIGFVTTNAERMRIAANGDVGIGTTSPAVSLDLSNETDALALPSGTNGLRPANLINGEIRYNSSIPGVEAFINGNWENLLDSSNSNAVVGSGTPNYVARWTPNGTTLGTGILYDNGAQVGVGTTSPTALLHVVDQNNAGWRFDEYNNGDGTNYRNYRARGTIAAPTGVLAGDRLASFLGGGYNGSSFNSPNGGISIWAAENYTSTSTGGTYLTFGTSPTGTNPAGGGLERMRIDSNGLVGIGTTVPGALLHVVNPAGGGSAVAFLDDDDTSAAPSQFLIRGYSNTNQQLMLGYNTAGDYGSIQAIKQGAAQEPLALNPGGGNVGIGTTNPGGLLELYNSYTSTNPSLKFNFTDSGGGNYYMQIMPYIVGGGNVGYKFVANNQSTTATPLAITGAGNVGIGTTAPTDSLDLGGSYSASGGLGVGTPTSTYNSVVAVQSSNTSNTRMLALFEPNLNTGGIVFQGQGVALSNYNSAFVGFNYVGAGSTSNYWSVGLYGANNILNVTGNGYVGIGTTAPYGVFQTRVGANENLAVSNPYAVAGAVQLAALNDADSALVPLEMRGSQFTMNGGSVGIGTTNPLNQLDVQGTSGSYTAISVSNPTNNSGVALEARSGYGAIQGLTNAEQNAYTLAINPFGGNVGIGLTSPQQPLHVNGNIAIGTQTVYSTLSSAANGTLSVSVSATPNAITVLNNGYVGIGSTAPANPLEVNGLINSMGTGSGYRLSRRDTNGQTWILYSPGGTNDMRFYDNTGNDRITFQSGGNVGIGTTNPGVKLVVSNNAGALPATPTGDLLQLASADGTQTRLILDAFGSQSTLDLRRADTTSAAPSALQTGEAMGAFDFIGYGQTGYLNNSGAKVSAIAAENWTDSTGAAALIFSTRASGNTSPSVERMRLDQNGNLGIGSTAPQVSLDMSQTTDAIALPSGTNGLRPANLINGEIRYNSSIPGVEAFINGNWENLLDSSNSNAVVGSGTPNYVARWTPNGTTLGTGTLYDNGSSVGIGTTSPQNTLHVNGGIVTTGGSSTYAAVPALTFFDQNSAGYIQSLDNGVAWEPLIVEASTFSFLSNGSSQGFYQNASGNVGIGTASPASNLDVYGPIYLSGRPALASDGTNTYLKAGASGGIYVQPNNAATTAVSILSGGNVGINTTNPGAPLEVNGNILVDGYIYKITASGNAAWMQQDGAGRQHWYWNTYGGTSPTFTDAGEDADDIMMHVQDSGALGGYMTFRTASGVGHNAGDAISWTNTFTTSIAGMRIGDGNMATNKLDVLGNAAFGSYAGTAAPANGLIVSGSSGFGTSSPLAALDVNGMIAADGGASITSNPPTVGTADGWKLGLWSNSYAFGIASWTLAVKTGQWFSLFGGNPANNATNTAPDTGATVSFDATRGWGLFGGAVGIGTASPTTTLDVRGPIQSLTNLGGTLPTIGSALSGGGGTMITWNGLSSTPGETDFINIFRNAGNTYSGGFAFFNMSSNTAVNTLPLMFITQTGLVGVGTTNPLGLVNAYAASGNALMGVEAGSNSYWAMQANATTNVLSFGPLASTNTITPVMTINTTGLGIGTTAPNYSLQVSPSGTAANVMISPQTWTTTADYAQLIMGDANHYYKSTFGVGTQINDVNGIFLTGTTVGISTTSAAQTLSVNGTESVTGELYVNNNGTGAGSGSTGTIQLGDGTISKSYGTNFTFASGIIPSVDNAQALGLTSARWSSLQVGTGNSSFAGSVGIGTAAARTAFDTYLGTMSGAANDYMKGQFSLSGGGTITWAGPNGNLSWTSRLIALPVSLPTSSVGYIDINMPTSIPTANVYDGSSRASASGVILKNWETLWAVHTPGGSNTAVSFYITAYAGGTNTPSNWIMVATVNGDDSSVKLGNGVTLASGATWNANSGSVAGTGITNYVARWTAPETLGTGVLYDNGTNVGIGTASPWSIFDVRPQSNTNFIVYGNTQVNSGTTTVLSSVNDANNGTQAMEFYANAYEFAGGNVGIGTTSPNYALHIGFNLGERIEGGSGVTAFSMGGNGNFYIDAPGVNGGRFTVKDSTGYVGIGTGGPSYLLDVGNFSTAASNSIRVASPSGYNSSLLLKEAGDNYGFTITNSNGVNGLDGLNILRNSNNSSGTSALFIGRDSGNVGIGTTGPQNTLETYGDNSQVVARASTSAGLTAVGAEVYNFQSATTYTGTFLRQFGATASGTLAGISEANMSELLLQNGSASMIYSNTAPIYFVTYNNTSPAMTITTGNNVGINTTNPGAPLEVNGNILVDGYIYKITASGNAAWMQQDGAGRQHWYWNTYGGTSPTFTDAGEDADDIMMHVQDSGALGGYMTFRTASGVGHNAGDAISWTNTFTTSIAGMRIGDGNMATNKLDVLGNAAFGSYAGTAAPANGLIVSGSSGFGTSSAGAQLAVNGVSTTAPALSVTDSSSSFDNGANYGMVNLTRNADTTKAHLAFIRAGNFVWQLGYAQNSNTLGFFPWNFNGTQGAPTLAFEYVGSSTGYVGIGTAGPATTLDVWNSSSSPASGASTWDSTGAQLNIDSAAGNTTNNGSALAFRSTLVSGAQGAFAAIAGIVDTTGHNYGDLVFYNRTDAAYATENMRIKYNGNVGIGTASPNSTLEVVGGAINFTNATSEGYGTLENDGGLHLAADSTTNGGMYLSAPAGFAFRNTYAGTTTSFLSTTAGNSYINASGGNVGIGTAGPTNALHVYSTTNAAGITVDGTTSPGITLDISETAKGYLGVATAANAYATGTVSGDTILRAQNNLILTAGGGSTMAPLYINTSGAVGIGTAGPRTALDTYQGTLSGSANDYIKGQFAMSGGGTVSWGGLGGLLSWSNRFIVMPISQTTSTNGYIDIIMPTSGSIPGAQVYNGTARSWSASGIVLNAWESLWAVHTPGGSNSSVTYYILDYNTYLFNAPSNWILVATVNGDDSSVKLGNGVTLGSGATWSANSGSVAGTGTANYVARWTGTETLGTGVLYDNGSAVGISYTSLGASTSLAVNGNVAIGTNTAQGGPWRLTLNGTYGLYALTTGGYGVAGIDNATTGTTFGGYFADASSGGYSVYATGSNGAYGVYSAGGGNYFAGNVGIGSTSPDSLLNVYTTATDANDQVGHLYSGANASGTSTTSLRLEKGAGYGGDVAGYITQGVGSGLKFSTLNGGGLSEVMRITNAGNVGIGTTGPSYPLQVGFANASTASTGSIAIGQGNGSGSYRLMKLGYDSNYNFGFFDSGSSTAQFSVNYGAPTNSMYINSSGNVGIGTTSVAEAALQFANSVGNKIVFYTNGTNTDYGIGLNSSNLNAFMPSGAHFSIRQNSYSGTEVSTIDYNGNGYFAGQVQAGASAILCSNCLAGYYQDSTNGAYRAIVGSSTTTGYYFQSNAGGGTTMYIGLGGSYNGRVGINNSVPAQALDVNGNIQLDATNPYIYSGGSWIGFSNGIYASGGTSYFQTQTQFRAGVHNDSAAYMEFDGGTSGYSYFAGNVGIATTTPAQKLEVNGNAQIDSILYLTNSNTYLQQAGPYSIYTSGGTLISTNYNISSNSSVGYRAVGIAPNNFNYVAGDNSVPYGFSLDNFDEHAGIFMQNNSSNSGDLMLYAGNNGSNYIRFVPYTWDGTNNHVGAPVMSVGVMSGDVGIGITAPGEPLDVNGIVRTNGQFVSTAPGAEFRGIDGNYGWFHYSDGTNYYFLLTASGNQYGSYNSLRPFYINLASGYVTMANGVQIAGGLTVDSEAVSGALTGTTFSFPNSPLGGLVGSYPNYNSNGRSFIYSISPSYETVANHYGISYQQSPNNAICIDGAGNCNVQFGMDSGTGTFAGSVTASSSATHGVMGTTTTGSTSYYGGYFVSGSYNGGIARADGYAFVGGGTVWATGNGLFNQSDARLKEDVNPLEGALDNLMKLRPVTYKWKKDSQAYMSSGDTVQLGLLAQEVEKVFPNIVIVNKAPPYTKRADGTLPLDATLKGGSYGVEYTKLIPVLIKAVQQLKEMFDGDHGLLAKLQALFDTDHAEIEKLKAANDSQAKAIEELRDLVVKQNAAFEAYKKAHP